MSLLCLLGNNTTCALCVQASKVPNCAGTQQSLAVRSPPPAEELAA